MAQQVFIKVVGFTDVERHALNTVFRLSEERPTSYWLWTPEVTVAPRVALLDGSSYEARVEAESPQNRKLKLVWIGEEPPKSVWRTFERPLSWPDVVTALDEEFTPHTEVEFDLDLDEPSQPATLDEGPATLPPEEEPPAATPQRRALIVNPSLEERLYLRAKLALNHVTLADEAESAAQALELLRSSQYLLAIVDFGASENWDFVRQLQAMKVTHVIVTRDAPGMWERIGAKFKGVAGFLPKPPDPEALQAILQRVND